jgi:hypothetical protein
MRNPHSTHVDVWSYRLMPARIFTLTISISICTASAVACPTYVSVIAGGNGSGSADGLGTTASFHSPAGMATDAAKIAVIIVSDDTWPLKSSGPVRISSLYRYSTIDLARVSLRRRRCEVTVSHRLRRDVLSRPAPCRQIKETIWSGDITVFWLCQHTRWRG